MAYLSAVLYKQITSFNQHPAYSSSWIAAILIIGLATFFGLKWKASKDESLNIETI
ncbi:hypothetical protein VHA01S_018_00010 [Vibrio halioticoli NBRC 102217]|uniref:Uncharacterized protein n=1 Tax=Vibrio halioticoli NBRC 102217 TaxID=1219072 RepID=V5FJU6_9VIBR|nr:hypothetical protein [Vibrio halioticoli]GAD89212.1 hypothetical protein VHA01S_018_00010 [Vibrio halioticoli NBRC 102217]